MHILCNEDAYYALFLFFLRFQRTMLLVYCIVWQRSVNFLVVFITIPRKKISLASKIAISQYSFLGKTSAEKSRLLSGIAQISEPPPPPPNSGNLVLFFLDVKTTFYAYDRKKVPMMIMIIAMIIMIVMMVILMIMMKK